MNNFAFGGPEPMYLLGSALYLIFVPFLFIYLPWRLGSWMKKQLWLTIFFYVDVILLALLLIHFELWNGFIDFFIPGLLLVGPILLVVDQLKLSKTFHASLRQFERVFLWLLTIYGAIAYIWQVLV